MGLALIVLINGSPGIGKTTLSAAAAIAWPALHIQFDEARETIGSRDSTGTMVTTNTIVEDALNWRVYKAAVDHLRRDSSAIVILDSTGISSRIPYLRFALGDYPQTLIRLRSAYSYMMATRKWGNRLSLERFRHIEEQVMDLKPDHEILVDGETVINLLDTLTNLVLT